MWGRKAKDWLQEKTQEVSRDGGKERTEGGREGGKSDEDVGKGGVFIRNSISHVEQGTIQGKSIPGTDEAIRSKANACVKLLPTSSLPKSSFPPLSPLFSGCRCDKLAFLMILRRMERIFSITWSVGERWRGGRGGGREEEEGEGGRKGGRELMGGGRLGCN